MNGARSGPLEDADGVDGYSQILSVLEDVNNKDYNSIRSWVGDDFDPEEFDLQEANDIIIEYFSQKDREN